MKIKRILPCICIDHRPEYGDSGTYGMPALQVYQCGLEGEYGQRYIPYCPNCGRGGLSDFKSDYSALKYWNKLQYSLWQAECEGIFEGEEPAAEPWRIEFFQELNAPDKEASL